MNLFNLWNSLAEICKIWFSAIWVHAWRKHFASTTSVHCLGLSKYIMHGLQTGWDDWQSTVLMKCNFKSPHLQRKEKLLEVTQDSSWRNAYINFYDNSVVQINPVCASSQCIALLLWEAYATWHWLSLLNGKNMLSLSSYTDVAYVPRSSLTVVLKIVCSVVILSLRRM